MSDSSESKPVAILLVEDSEDDIFFFKRIVNRSGINASLSIVRDGNTAMEHLKAVQQGSNGEKFPTPEIVFLDLKLPHYSGFDILRWMGETGLLAKVPVIVLTGSEEERDKKLVESLGAKDFITKPLSGPHLVETLKRTLETRPTQN